ncbi:MAG: linear amide C-N hydrolase [Clostridia bacterium]|nr:linear amide C-N hydrolase [Clostridia bacterium]
MKKTAALLLSILLCLPFGFSAGEESTALLSPERLQTIASIQKLSDYDDGLNLYSMEVFYDYDIDDLTPTGELDDEGMVALLLNEALPGIPVQITAPDFGCTAFTLKADDGKVYMGRNYDFKYDTSAMMCHCHPKDGYSSVCFSALSNLGMNDPFESETTMAAMLAAPLIPLDGMNEKGLAIAVLTLPSEPTRQHNGNPILTTPVLIRLVLDRCATTQEAVDMIARYDYMATSGRDYHYYITDASGDGRVVEWDCEKEDRPMVVTPLRTITNYFAMYEDRVISGQQNGMYGQGKERRDKVEAVIGAAGTAAEKETAWDAAKAASTAPDPESIISNTQWTVVYNITDLTHEFTLHRHWEDRFSFDVLNK